ncbi:MAG: ankyrin repeat domain-containing protein [Candidatus Berkiella sp.]
MLLSPRILANTTKFTRLHQAASDGNVRAIKNILRTSPDSVFAVDEDGLTPLHHAALNGHFNAVKALAPNGEAIYELDKEGFLPISYVNAKLHPEIIQYLMEKNSYPTLTTNIHLAAIDGNIDELKRLLILDPENLEKINGDNLTPLMNAIINNQKCAAEFLVKAGANIEVLDSTQNDLVALAKDLPILGYAKRLCGLTPIDINQLKQQFKTLIEREKNTAAAQNKQLLILLGETHHLYKIMQLEEMMYRVAKNLGIDTLLVEARPDIEELYPTDMTAQALGMRVTAIDHPSLEASMAERNTHMTNVILAANQSAIVRIGSDHLQGILEMPGNANVAFLFHQRFHIVPFNLSTIVNNFVPLTDEAAFALNENNAILVRQQGLSQSETVLKRWNTPPQPVGIANMVFNYIQPLLPSIGSISGTPQTSLKHQAEEATSSTPKRMRKK